MMFRSRNSSVLASIAVLLLLNQLIALAGCESVAQAIDKPQIDETVATALSSTNGIALTRASSRQSDENEQEASGKFRLINFEAFQARFGKHYSSLLERLFRLRQFLDSLARVSRSVLAYLGKKSTFFLRINRNSDLTLAEHLAKFGQQPDSGIDLSSEAEREGRVLSRQKRGWLFGGNKKETRALEYELDWRNESSAPKCLNEPQLDQGDCGCCYAMASMRLVEWLHCKQHGRPIKLSEQYLVDCGREHGLDGCQKGSLLGALEFIEAAGVMRAEQMPFLAEEDTCPGSARRSAIQVKGVQRRLVRKRENWPGELASAPLLVFLTISADFFDYGGGLFELRKCERGVGHFMLLVGHGRDSNHKGRPFFLLSNSFGPDYGESGYIRVAADRVDGRCDMYGLAVEATF